MKFAMIGTGNVGLVTGTCCADWGHPVVCIDIRQVMRVPVCVDPRNVYPPAVLEQHGLTRAGIGRPTPIGHPAHRMQRKNGAIRTADDSASAIPAEPSSSSWGTTVENPTARHLQEEVSS